MTSMVCCKEDANAATAHSLSCELPLDSNTENLCHFDRPIMLMQ